MIGRHRGFIAHLKREIPDLFTIHCVIHRQHLVAKHLSDRLHSTLQAVIRAVDKIKAHSLNDRIFRQLCHENEEEFERLLLHTEARWLSKGKCLQRFYSLYDSVIDFFKFKLLDEKVSSDLESRRADVAYLSDIFKKLNEVNITLQGTKMCLIKAKGIIMAFISKLDFYKKCLLRLDLNQFPNLEAVQENQTDDSCLSDTDLDCCSSHFQTLKDLLIRFKDLKELKIPGCVVNPFQDDANNADPNLVEELIDLQNDFEGEMLFPQIGYEAFWLNEQVKYPHLWEKIKSLLLAFLSSHLVEKGFSSVLQLLTKQKNRLQICKRGDLRLFLSNIEPDIIKLANSHKAQGSHCK